MKRTWQTIPVEILLAGGIAIIGAPSADAQMSMSGAGRSLGGYGAATIGQYYSNGTSSYMPYNGNASGFVPYQGGYGGGLGVQPIARRLPQTSIGGASMAMTPIGGTSVVVGMRAGIGMGLGGPPIGTPMTKQAGMRRSPSGPGFRYPIQGPTLPFEPGMSIMAMP